MDAALSGIRSALQLAEASARNIANARLDPGGEPTGLGPPVSDLVALIEARNQVAFNARVLRAEDDMLGTLLDTFA